MARRTGFGLTKPAKIGLFAGLIVLVIIGISMVIMMSSVPSTGGDVKPSTGVTVKGSGIDYIGGSGKWKHTDDPNDPACATNWNYYDKNKNLILGNIANITKQGDTKNWCALKA